MKITENIFICRAPRDGQHPYMQLFRKVPQDDALSFEELGFLVYILSLPKSYVVDLVRIAEHRKVGRDRVRKIMNNLVKHGYCQIHKTKNAQGRYDKTFYCFYEEKIVPQVVDTKQEDPAPENQGVAHNEYEPQPENQGVESRAWNSGDGHLEKNEGNYASHIRTLDTFHKSKDKRTGEDGDKSPVCSSSSSNSNQPSSEAKQLQKDIEQAMKEHPVCSPTWNAPNSHFLALQCDILLRAGATYQSIIKCLLWALNDVWWVKQLYSSKTNPGTVIRKNYDSWYAAMIAEQRKDAKPKYNAYEKKGFGAPCSQEVEDQLIKQFNEGFTNAYQQ